MSPGPLARRKVMLDEREKASVPCELAAAASARSANVKMAPPCVRAPAFRCSGFISNLALLYPLRTSSSTTPAFSANKSFLKNSCGVMIVAFEVYSANVSIYFVYLQGRFVYICN